MLNGYSGMNGGPGVTQLFSGMGEILVTVMNRTEIEGLLMVTAGRPVD